MFVRSIDARKIVCNSSMFYVPFSVDALVTVRNSKLKCKTSGGWNLLPAENIIYAG